MMLKTPKKIVVIGGGTGTHTVLSGLKKYPADNIDLTAIVTVADSGGSTGRLRDEFGYLPVGDFRMALVALADDTEVGGVLRDLFLYRFEKGEGLKGHNFGNLFLVAMTDLFGSEERAIEFASKILRVRGRVLPIATKKLTLVAEYEDGTIIKGEAEIDEPHEKHDGSQRIIKLSIEEESVAITSQAKRAIEDADMIILGPGDLYTSTLANIVVKGAREAIEGSKARIVSITNLMSKYGQTHGLSALGHAQELERYIGRLPDHILINDNTLPKDILGEYESQREIPIVDDLHLLTSGNILRGDLLATKKITRSSGDTLKRSLIRHDPDKIAQVIMSLL